MDGPMLSADDADHGLLVLDGTWRWTEAMERDFKDVPARSLPPWQTAYPRVSKTFNNDPPTGLATIEAIYAAYTILARNTHDLLDDYHWAEEFLKRNEEWL
jgi:pre-rRNA-processing protein TSR3